MRFIQRYHLDRHKRVHSGEKPYQCDRCHQVSRPCFYYCTIKKKSTCLGSASSIAPLSLTKTHTSLCPAAELLTDRPAAETPTAMYSWGEQRGKPVFTGCICPSCFLEPPTAFQQPPDCLTQSFQQRPNRQQQSAAQCQ